MYLLRVNFDNAREGGRGSLDVRADRDEIAKWTILDNGPSSLELLRLISAACGGTSLVPRLGFDFRRLLRDFTRPVQVETLLALHPPYEASPAKAGPAAAGIRLTAKGEALSLRRSDFNPIPSVRLIKAKRGMGSSAWFFLGYGPDSPIHEGTDDFDFSDPCFRTTRFRSLFCRRARLTDPVEFLTRLHYRAIRWRRAATGGALERLVFLLGEHMGIDAGRWLDRLCDFTREWKRFDDTQRRALSVTLDAMRHLSDGYARSRAPLDAPTLILCHRPDLRCGRLFRNWMLLMDRFLPQTQFLVTLGKSSRRRLPRGLLNASLGIPAPAMRPGRRSLARFPRGAVLLVDVDSRLPNVALMKLSRSLKEQGRRVILARHEDFMAGADSVYASAVFSTSTTMRRLERLKKHYGDALLAGGSGIDVKRRLPPDVEGLPADYTLYPELADRAIGFLTRGCPFHCPFCLVPDKEGGVRQVGDFDELLGKRRRKLILLDDNILAHPKAKIFLEEMIRRSLAVNFNQSLDLRLVDRDIARLLKRVQCSNLRFTRRVFHFSLNNNRNLDRLRRNYELFGFTRSDNVEFLCMYGFDTTLAQDLERFRFLRSLAGAYVFVQPYRQVPGGPPAKTKGFFDARADERIDELTGILFPQNMKSMEHYYRWVSRLYAETFGRPHMGLVDTIFRYNHREQRGHYLATLAHESRE